MPLFTHPHVACMTFVPLWKTKGSVFKSMDAALFYTLKVDGDHH